MLLTKERMNCSRNSIYNIFIFQKKRAKGGNHAGFLSSEELNEWLCASDIVLIQRKDILNSGNVALAYSASKVVVGPDLGNVGEILKETHNYIFNPDNREMVCKEVKKAIDACRKDRNLGSANYEYAKNNWNTAKVCNDVISNLKELLISNKN